MFQEAIWKRLSTWERFKQTRKLNNNGLRIKSQRDLRVRSRRLQLRNRPIGGQFVYTGDDPTISTEKDEFGHYVLWDDGPE